MKRFLTLLLGIFLGVAYAFLTLALLDHIHATVSIGYVFALPIVMGAIPALLVTKAQLKNYLNCLLIPWASVITFCLLCIVSGLDGLICIIIIIAPFLVLGTLGAFIVRMVRLKEKEILPSDCMSVSCYHFGFCLWRAVFKFKITLEQSKRS